MDWQENVAQTIGFRRKLHGIPELRWQEEQTVSFIKEQLTCAGIAWRSCAQTGVVAYLAQGLRGRKLGFRADMDGLALNERSDAAWTSKHHGIMHGCGHDGHMAALLGAALWMKQHEEDLTGPVTLLFQPAEEGGHGAREMILDGALETIDVIYGWHNWPAIPFGKAVCPSGPVMAANGSFHITLAGRGGHASQPELCRDPVLAAAALTVDLQQIVSRRLAPQDAAVVSVTSINAPSGETTIPDTAVLGGTVRGGTTELVQKIGLWIENITASTAAAYDVGYEVSISPRYPATVNNAEAAKNMSSVLMDILGNEWCCSDIAVPLMASEDFSYYLEKIPGAFALVGAGDNGAFSVPCHNVRYDFNDGLLEPMMKVFLRLAGLEA